MHHLKKEFSRLNLVAVVFLFILFMPQSVSADSIYAFWKANKSSNQIFYSASYDGTNWFSYDDQTTSQPIASDGKDITTTSPAATAFNGKFYLVWSSDDQYNRIYYSVSGNGNSWSDGKPINGVANSTDAPAIIVFDDKLYVFWRATSQVNSYSYPISYIYSSDGKNWSPISHINEIDTTSATPAVATDGKELYVFWKATNSSNRIFYSASSDGKNWPDGKTVNSFATSAAPAATYNGNLYLVWKDNDSNHILYSHSSDGSSWSSQQPINDVDTTSDAPTAAVYDNSVFIAWRDEDSSNIYYSASSDGKAWPNGQPISSTDTTLSAPALAAPFSPDLSYNYDCWSTNNGGNSLLDAKCCQPGVVFCGNGDSEDFSTGHNNKDPYKGTLDPKQNLKLTLQCGWEGRKVESTNLNHEKHISCNHSQKEKGIKIYSCQNNSDDEQQTWELESYKCHG